MEIIKKKSAAYLFRVLRPFRWGGHTTEIGQEVEMSPAEGLGAVRNRRAIPVDVPEIGQYIALGDITLPGNEKAFKARRGEKILLKRAEAVELMLQRLALPVDHTQWRPESNRESEDSR